LIGDREVTQDRNRRRHALLIGVDRFDDERLANLRSPEQDVKGLSRILEDEEVGGFRVHTILNQPKYKIEEAIEEFFKVRERGDFALLYYSGHGLKDLRGSLYFAAKNTDKDRLDSRALSAAFVTKQMHHTRADQVVLMLDCCYSGAFSDKLVGKASDDMSASLSAPGVAWMTASTAYEYAFEPDGTVRSIGPHRTSMFTSAVIEGLDSGSADIDNDGLINFDELFTYAADHMRRQASPQTPTKSQLGVQGQIFIARRRGGALTIPAAGPPMELEPLKFRVPRLLSLALAALRITVVVAAMIALRMLHLSAADGTLTSFEQRALQFGVLLAYGSAGVAMWRSLWSTAVVDSHGITTHRWRPRLVTWAELDSIQIRSNWLGKSTYAICLDGSEILLAAPRTTLLVRNRDFYADVELITQWHEQATGERQDPPTATNGGAAWSTLWGVSAVCALIMLAFIIKPEAIWKRLNDRSFSAQPCTRWTTSATSSVLPSTAVLEPIGLDPESCRWGWELQNFAKYNSQLVVGSLSLNAQLITSGNLDDASAAHDQMVSSVTPPQWARPTVPQPDLGEHGVISQTVAGIGNEAYMWYCIDTCGSNSLYETAFVGRRGNVIITWHYEGALPPNQVSPALEALLRNALDAVH